MVPKVACPSSVMEFRPIACCNVLYKIITKVLCNRLKMVLPSLISKNQGAFVHERFIVHNIMVCQDLVKHYGRKGVRPSVLMKLDMKKVYDTIGWDFLQEMLVALKFPSHFVNLIMVCVRTPKFSLMINGSLHGFFEAKRGIRQGDPMSPLLFVICMEYMSRVMNILQEVPRFSFHPRCKNLKLNHLVFADDVILCCKGDFPSAYLILQAFQIFSNSSGLRINEMKSEFYSAGMDHNTIQRIREVSGFRHSRLPFRYLGVPISARRVSVGECHVLVDKMCAKIKVWQSRNLSYSGTLQLVNLVLLSIHIYWAQIYIMHRSVLEKIEQVCRAYLWHGTHFSMKAGNVAWDRVCLEKKAGGMGIRNINLWNKAAMMKYVWAITAKQDSMWIKWVNGVYIKAENWWEYTPNSGSSWYWKQSCRMKEEAKIIYSENELKQITKFSIKKCYQLLVGKMDRVHWDRFF